MSTKRDAEATGQRRFQIRLSTLLLLAPLLALTLALGFWVQSLRHQVLSLEGRVATIEKRNGALQLLSMGRAPRTVPESVDRAMLSDGLRTPGSSMPTMRMPAY